MPKTEAELKEAASKLRTDTKLGRAGAAQTATLLADLVAFVTAGHTAAFDAVLNPAAQNTTTTAPETLASAAPGPQATVGEIPQPAKRRGRKGVQIGSAPINGDVKVGGDATPAVTATVAGAPAKAPVIADTANKSIPHNVKAGRGVRVGSQVDKVDTGVRVGSVPVNPAGQVTVGGRPRN